MRKSKSRGQFNEHFRLEKISQIKLEEIYFVSEPGFCTW
jgi:hypothetical protein